MYVQLKFNQAFFSCLIILLSIKDIFTQICTEQSQKKEIMLTTYRLLNVAADCSGGSPKNHGFWIREEGV
jgi:hypothetical protein